MLTVFVRGRRPVRGRTVGAGCHDEPMPRMRVGETLHSDTGTPYLVAGPLGEGGFGEAYVGQRLSPPGAQSQPVAIKVCKSLEDWHGEAYFGRLLQGDPRVVELLDAFVTATGRGQRQRRRHVLVFEYMDEGTVWDAVERDGLRWSEGKVRAEIRALLKLLRRMHGVWIIHRDIKPDNVYLRDGRLVLGDFGITKLALDQKGADASKFQPDFAPRDLASSTMWGPAEDIFQVGLLAATLLSGEIWWNDVVSARAIAGLDAERRVQELDLARDRGPVQALLARRRRPRRAVLAAPRRRRAGPGAAHPARPAGGVHRPARRDDPRPGDGARPGGRAPTRRPG